MSKPLVSIIMPAFNAGKFIKESIQSVLTQTFTDFELLVINDGSGDNTLEVAETFTDKRVRVISNPGNIGLTKTLNVGLRESCGKYIARLDSDDLAYPIRLARQVSVLENDPKIGLVASWTQIIDEEGNGKGLGNWVFEPEHLYYILHFRNCLTHSSVLFVKDLICDLGGYSESAFKCEDFDLWGRISKKAKVVQLQEVLVKWREHGCSITSRGHEEMEEGAARVCRNNLYLLTRQLYDMDLVKCLIDCRHVRKLKEDQVKTLAEILPAILEEILDKAPAYCRKEVLRQYINVEAQKYGFIFKELEYHWDIPEKWRILPKDKTLGLGYYLTRYKSVPLLSRLLPKSHF